MSGNEEEQADGRAPGLPQLGARLLIGALLVIAALLWMQRWGAGDRRDRESFAHASGTIRLAELTEPVEILRDARGIPHVISGRESEVWFGLGFAHAQDRLAQMVSLRRRAQGRSAEFEGEGALVSDRLARILEIRRVSDASVEGLPEASRAVLEAYAAGVNARMARIRQGQMRAPVMLSGTIEEVDPWRPADSLAVVKLLSWCIGGTLETTLVLDQLIQRLDSVPARPFFPGRASIDFGVAPDLPSLLASPEPSDRAASEEEDLFGSTRALCRGVGLPTGGAWVIDGSMSESGAPLLVADWHLEPTLPALFYEVQLESEDFNVAGVSLPGSPILWAGRNRSFAWAGVPAGAPVSNLFIETLREDRDLYQNGTLWAPLEEREETLRWKDARGVVQESTFRLRSTRHGPLIESMLDDAGGGGSEEGRDALRTSRALAWTGAREGDGLSSMLALLRLSDAEGIREVLADHHEPVLAFVYADRAGRGGFQVAGWLPLRPLPTGLVPVQGRLRSFDWRERVPISTLPSQRLGDTRKPWVFAMDQEWAPRGGLDQMEWLWRPGDRAARLDFQLERLRKDGPLSLRAASDLVDDKVAQRAPRVVASILGLARRAGPLPIEAVEIASLLEVWEGDMGIQSAGAAAYHLLLGHLLENLFRAQFGDELFQRYLEAPHVRPQYAIERLVLRAAKVRTSGGWTDEVRVGKAARESLREAWVSLNLRLGPTRDRWSWGRLHRLRFAPLGPIGSTKLDPMLSRRVAGSGQTLAFSRYRPGISFDVERAGMYRVAMDLAGPDRLLSSLAPGQSEHPGHPHFADGVGRWASSRLSLFATSRLVIEEENAQSLMLEPTP